MLGLNIIEGVQAESVAPTVFPPKMDAASHFGVNYCRCNAVTKRDFYPMPRMDECIDSLGQKPVFAKLGTNSGYWNIEKNKPIHNKTAFKSHRVLNHIIRVPFGIRNAPGIFQRTIDVALFAVQWKFALVYVDNIVIISNPSMEHILTRANFSRSSTTK